jgi:PTH1 family peptidyl-tRNA hydrolase
MNLSGVAVGELARWYKVAVEDIIIIFDDMDLPTGRLRLRMKGGSGGHRGIESLLTHLSKDSFPRVRVGIGRPPAGWQVVDYVLSSFTAEEQPLLKAAIEKAADATESILEQGMNKAMNLHNK